MKVEQLNLAEMGGKWKKVEEGDKPSLVKGVLSLIGYLMALRMLKEKEDPPI